MIGAEALEVKNSQSLQFSCKRFTKIKTITTDLDIEAKIFLKKEKINTAKHS